MNRELFWSVVCFVLGYLCLPIEAEACSRCGLFGNRCRYAQTYYYPSYVPAPTTTNLIFNNSYPVPLLGPQGSTVYGYSLASSALAFDPALYMDRAGRYTELSLQAARVAAEGYNANAATAMALTDAADRRAKNTALALAAIEANRTPVPPQTISLTIRDGKVIVNEIPSINTGEGRKDVCEVPPAPSPSPAPNGLNPLGNAPLTLSLACGKCHDGRGPTPMSPNRPPAYSRIGDDIAITEEFYHKAVSQIQNGTMPPESNLTESQKASLIAKLSALISR